LVGPTFSFSSSGGFSLAHVATNQKVLWGSDTLVALQPAASKRFPSLLHVARPASIVCHRCRQLRNSRAQEVFDSTERNASFNKGYCKIGILKYLTGLNVHGPVAPVRGIFMRFGNYMPRMGTVLGIRPSSNNPKDLKAKHKDTIKFHLVGSKWKGGGFCCSNAAEPKIKKLATEGEVPSGVE
jgi:hypothetical protein